MQTRDEEDQNLISNNNYNQYPTTQDQSRLVNDKDDEDYYGQAQSVGSFSDSKIRLGFIRKVYLILSTQLLFTAFVIYFSCTNWSFAQFQIENFWLALVAIIAIIPLIIMICCFPDTFARKVPTNYIMLSIFTACMSYYASFYCATVVWNLDGTLVPGGQQLVIIAAFLTAGLTIALTIYAMTTKTDFTVFIGMMWALSFCALGLLIIVLITGSTELYYIYLVFILLLYSLYLIIDTQMITGQLGDHHFTLKVDDYIFGAIALYIDIIYLFLTILRLLGGRD